MKHGDFTELAKYYVDRPGYSLTHLRFIADHVRSLAGAGEIVVADVGAGTGKLTENLSQIGMQGFAVEPNDVMRAEGERLFSGTSGFTWKKGSAEQTGLSDDSVNWLLMGSSFHWVEPVAARIEFRRVLKKNGLFTAIWNTRDVESDPIVHEIEELVDSYVPRRNRVSSGASVTMEIMSEKLGDEFEDIIYMEDTFCERMSKERYMNVWRSVNDIKVQAGDKFNELLQGIERIISNQNEILMHYRIRSWTARVVK